jgi:hypothetical protein
MTQARTVVNIFDTGKRAVDGRPFLKAGDGFLCTSKVLGITCTNVSQSISRHRRVAYQLPAKHLGQNQYF